MRYHRLADGDGRLIAVPEGPDDGIDLTSAKPDLTRFRDLARAADHSDRSIDDIARSLADDADRVDPDPGSDALALPVVPSEVWAAGVTYEISEAARESESGTPDLYLDVYDADRPEVFFKATPARTVGPGAAVGVRADSDWDVPEPELGLVVYRGSVVGYTVGNDVSSRDIEGANPLYLPQAKVYDRSCALGPAVASADGLDPSDLGIEMRIDRDGATVFEGAASTAEMVREPEALLAYTQRCNDMPPLWVLLTGTSVVPDESFTLRPGDRVSMAIDGIGTLENGVVTVGDADG